MPSFGTMDDNSSLAIEKGPTWGFQVLTVSRPTLRVTTKKYYRIYKMENNLSSLSKKSFAFLLKPIVYDENFSDERWKALDIYVAKSSRWTVTYDCIKPIIIIPIIMFCIYGAMPLRPIEEGFLSNYSLVSIYLISGQAQ